MSELLPVLMVGQKAGLGRVSERLLVQAGYTAENAESLDAAWELFRHERFAAVVCDCRDGVIDGAELCHRIRMTSHSIPVVILADESAEMTDWHWEQAGANHTVRGVISPAIVISSITTARCEASTSR